jgi:hypothetical protein
MKREELIAALGNLGYPLIVTGKPRMTQKKTVEVLDALGNSTEPRLVEGFPVILANCAHRGMKLDSQALLARYPLKSPKRQNLEKLLLVSSLLLNQEGLEEPKGLGSLAESLKAQYGDLLTEETLTLAKGMALSTNRLRRTLRRYASDLKDSESAKEREKLRQEQSFQLHMHLSTLFSEKQKELVLKKLQGEPFTKTEQEYYSRVVKKKLEALANSELRRIATTLTKK